MARLRESYRKRKGFMAAVYCSRSALKDIQSTVKLSQHKKYWQYERTTTVCNHTYGCMRDKQKREKVAAPDYRLCPLHFLCTTNM